MKAQRVFHGFPAHAGMDLLYLWATAPKLRFPRPRGDGPDLDCMLANFWRVSPPTRGWTQPWPDGSLTIKGFPAHAGMDPKCAPPKT